MKDNKKIIAAIIVVLIAIAALLFAILDTAGGKLDVIGEGSIEAFEKILQTVPNQVQTANTNRGWSLLAPDGTARFIWSENYGNTQYDVLFELDAQPFIDAGLDTAKLPENYTVNDGMLLVGADLGNDATVEGEATPLAAYEQIAREHRESVSYHMAMDHYTLDLGDGNAFEWAKDLDMSAATGESQDKDIVFALNPEPLIAAGVNPESVEGWVYSQVEMHEHGKSLKVWKLLKPFDLA